MRLRLLVGLVFGMAALIAACQGPPPTQYVLVVTELVVVTATSELDGATPATSQALIVQSPTPTPIPPSATPQATPTLDPFPTPTVSQIQMAEQVFEHGRMFWVQPVKQIWVMVETESGKGTWQVYPDVFQDGEQEFDPSIVPPDGMFQPERGFGKLWRENSAVKEALGWGLTPEFGYVSSYEYHPGGKVEAGKYVAGPGYHILSSLYQERFQFNEADGTWQKL